MRRALVVGSEGQDGVLLTRRLQADGWEVAGATRGAGRPEKVPGTRPGPDVLDASAVSAFLREFAPDEIYYLAAVHHSAQDRALLSGAGLYPDCHAVHVTGLLNVLEAMRTGSPSSRLFYAASCLVFGEPDTARQDERTPLAPVCMYGITKTAGIHCCRFYRRSHLVAASTGILYQHESPERKPGFLSRKVVQGAVDIRTGRAKTLVLGDLSATNDWGWAEDTVDAMVRIVRTEPADDYVVATGEAHTVREFVEIVFARAGIDWRRRVVEDPTQIARRRATLIGDASRLRERTGWRPSLDFRQMCERLWDEAWAREQATGRSSKGDDSTLAGSA